MEEDIEIIKTLDTGDDIELKTALENLLTRYKQLEEENRTLKRVNKMTKDISIEDITQVMDKAYKDFMKEFIPKSKVKEKKKEKEESFKKTCELHDCDTKFEALNKLQCEIDLCEELLEEE